MSFHYDILPAPMNRAEMVMSSYALQERMQTFIKVVAGGQKMTDEEIDMADRRCYLAAGVDYSRRQEADDWHICMKLMRITEGGLTGRAAMEKLKSEFDENTEEELMAAMDRFQKSVDKQQGGPDNRARTA